MKTNHNKIILLINQAIQACADDVLSPAKKHLREALQIVSDIGEKRQKRQTQIEIYKEKAEKKHKEWWESLKKAALKELPEEFKQDPPPD